MRSLYGKARYARCVKGGGIGRRPGLRRARGASAEVVSLPVVQSPDDQFGFQPAERKLLHKVVEVLAGVHLRQKPKWHLRFRALGLEIKLRFML